jgi:hypothetical protein
VEALVEAAQPARRQVEVPADELGLEQLAGERAGEARSVAWNRSSRSCGVVTGDSISENGAPLPA